MKLVPVPPDDLTLYLIDTDHRHVVDLAKPVQLGTEGLQVSGSPNSLPWAELTAEEGS